MTPPAGWFRIGNAAVERAAEVGASAWLVYSLLCRHANEERRCWPGIERLAEMSGMKRRNVQYAIRRLEALGWVRVQRDNGNRNVYHLPPIGPVQSGAPVHDIARDQCNHVHGTGAKACTGPVQPVAPEEDLLKKTIEEDLKKKTSSAPKLRFEPADRATAEWMFDLIRKIDQGAKQPNLNRWANDIRLMRERDGRDDDQIRAVFGWANQDDFWRANILCPDKLRKQFSTLKLKMTGISNGKRKRGFPVGPGQRHPADAAAGTF